MKSVFVQCPGCEHRMPGSDVPGTRVKCAHCGAVLVVAHIATAPATGAEAPAWLFARERPQKPDHSLELLHRQAAVALLARWLDLEASLIDECLTLLAENRAYESWAIPKSTPGAFRVIDAPVEPLKQVQRRILDRLLYRIAVSNACHGFMPGRSIVTGARVHLENAREVFNLDLKDAFPSVDAVRVKHNLVRYLKVPLQRLGESAPLWVLDDAIRALTALVTFQGRLPQGGPCSGWLLNVACIKLDKYLFALVAGYDPGMRYTRYADDLTFSTGDRMSQKLRQDLQQVITRAGFRVHPEKIRYLRRDEGDVLEVTGLILEKGKVRIPRAKLDTYRAAIHNAAQAAPGSLDEGKKREIRSIIAYVQMVYPALPRKISDPYHRYLSAHQIPAPGKTRKGPAWEAYP